MRGFLFNEAYQLVIFTAGEHTHTHTI